MSTIVKLSWCKYIDKIDWKYTKTDAVKSAFATLLPWELTLAYEASWYSLVTHRRPSLLWFVFVLMTRKWRIIWCYMLLKLLHTFCVNLETQLGQQHITIRVSFAFYCLGNRTSCISHNAVRIERPVCDCCYCWDRAFYSTLSPQNASHAFDAVYVSTARAVQFRRHFQMRPPILCVLKIHRVYPQRNKNVFFFKYNGEHGLTIILNL